MDDMDEMFSKSVDQLTTRDYKSIGELVSKLVDILTGTTKSEFNQKD